LNRPATIIPPDIEAAHTDLPINVNPTTTEEIRIAVRQIKSMKTAGPDNITAEALKSDIEIWEEEQVPMDWKEGHLVK
uniref:Aldo/keto reductase n=1 Tax=Schistosoma curassoni TaxID=6186 RepID=A0A183JUA7_9TREM